MLTGTGAAIEGGGFDVLLFRAGGVGPAAPGRRMISFTFSAAWPSWPSRECEKLRSWRECSDGIKAAD